LAVVVAVKPTDTFSYLFVQFLGNAVVFVTAKDKGRGYLDFSKCKIYVGISCCTWASGIIGNNFCYLYLSVVCI